MTTGAEQPAGGPNEFEAASGFEAAASAFEAAGPEAVGWGTAFGSGYLLQREIGVGGMGTVWRGWSLVEQRAVAIKILHPHLSGDQGVVGRFLREGDVLKRLDHPNLVRVHDLVVEGGRLGLVLDLVEGGDLHKRRKQHGTLPAAEVARIGAQVAGALAAAHELGVAHLDLKPANILVAPRPPGDQHLYDVRLTDFGISRIVDAADQAVTTTTYGTPDYMAPETGLTGAASPACDVYALAMTLYELLVGRTPHGGGQALAVLARHIERMPKRLHTIPDPLWEVIAACSAREPAARPTAASVAAALTTAAADPALPRIPAAEPLPPGTGFEATSELRDTHPDAATIAVPWLAAVAAANRPPQPPPPEESPTVVSPVGGGPPAAPPAQQPPPPFSSPSSGSGSSSSDDAIAAAAAVVAAAASRKPPPESPFSTAPTRPDTHEHPDAPTPTFPSKTRRRAAMIGAPLLVLTVVGTLFATGAFGGTPASASGSAAGTHALNAQGSDQLGGQSGSARRATGSLSAHTSNSSPTSPTPTTATSSATATSTQGASDTTTGGSSNTVTETTTNAGSVGGTSTSTGGGGSGGGSSTTTPATTTNASPTATDTGWVCRSGGFKVDGALSEDPCIRDDDGTLMLEGELKGTYASPVVVVVRVDYGGVYSTADVSQSVTPSKLGGKTFVYKVILGSWAAGELITCQENVNPASNLSDYEYTSNSTDIRTP